MDRLKEMEIFARIVETKSFKGASEALDIPLSTVSAAVKKAEDRLGTRLLVRASGTVEPTVEGLAWAKRCSAIVQEVEDAHALFIGGTPAGQLRIDIDPALARHFVMPQLQDFLKANPGLNLDLSSGNPDAGFIRSNLDCAVRLGKFKDEQLSSVELGEVPSVTVASPAYLERYGMPATLDEFQGHRLIGTSSDLSKDSESVAFKVYGTRVLRNVPKIFDSSFCDVRLAGALSGLGIAQIPRFIAEAHIRRGDLVVLFGEAPPWAVPVTASYPLNRQLAPRLRVFLDLLSRIDFSEKDVYGS
jgi:DNA-binding transcriptional LysR family regulator